MEQEFPGYPAAERFETGIFTTVAQEGLEIARQVMKDAFDSGSGETEAWLLGKNGAKACCYLTGVWIIFENAPGVLEIAVAVSKGLRAQEDAKSQAAATDAGGTSLRVRARSYHLLRICQCG